MGGSAAEGVSALPLLTCPPASSHGGGLALAPIGRQDALQLNDTIAAGDDVLADEYVPHNRRAQKERRRRYQSKRS